MIQILSGIDNTTAALNAERTRLDVISENIANANTTKGLDGKPYQRKVVVFESALQQALNPGEAPNAQVQVARVDTDKRDPIQVYEPGNPEANSKGFVSMPNINIHEEMADLISASRSFEANLAVVKNARAMAIQTLALGRH